MMTTDDDRLVLLTEKGLRRGHEGALIKTPFDDSPATGGDVLEDNAAVIVDRREIWTQNEAGWQRLAESDLRLNCLRWTREKKLLVGTAEARLAWVGEDGLEFIEAFDTLEGREAWTTPWGGPPDVRSLAVASDGTLYANIHVGWIVRSVDGGTTWQNIRKDLEKDVHQVSVHPQDPATVFAATADGFYLSHDHGESFARRNRGLPYLYARASVCFEGRDVYLISVSRGPSGNVDAQLYRSEDEGQQWSAVRGLTETINRNLNTDQLVVLGEGAAWIIVDNHALYETVDYGQRWIEIVSDLPQTFGILRLPKSV